MVEATAKLVSAITQPDSDEGRFEPLETVTVVTPLTFTAQQFVLDPDERCRDHRTQFVEHPLYDLVLDVEAAPLCIVVPLWPLDTSVSAQASSIESVLRTLRAKPSIRGKP